MCELSFCSESVKEIDFPDALVAAKKNVIDGAVDELICRCGDWCDTISHAFGDKMRQSPRMYVA